jgi:hypothetical protein
METGRHVCRARRGKRFSRQVAFESLPSKRKGFLRVSPKDRRYLAFEDGTPFFAIGQNTAFIGASQYLDLRKAEEVFRKMSEHGANYARIWACCKDWAMAIEERKSAWGRSWSWKPPFAPAPGMEGRTCVKVTAKPVAVSPSHEVALRPGTRYVLSGRVRTDSGTELVIELGGRPFGEPVRSENAWKEFRHPFTAGADQRWLGRLALRASGTGNAWVRKISINEAEGGPELLWEADLDRPARGVYNLPDAFMLDAVVAAAERHGIYLQLCILPRDLYMKDLAREGTPEYRRAVEDAGRLLRYAVARWGYSTNVAMWEYFNEMNPGMPTGGAYRAWARLLDEIDVYCHLRATSAWAPAPKDWSEASLDSADLHWYLRPTWGELSKDAALAVLDRAKLIRAKAPAKPAFLSEFGLADDRWGKSPHMAKDKNLVHFHNALWSSALSGLSGTAMFWWWDQLDRMDAYRHYRPLADFMATVPIDSARLESFSSTPPGAIRVVGLKGKDCAYAWISTPEAAWWKRVVENKPVPETMGARLAIEGLEPGAYDVVWWHTREGKAIRTDRATSARGRLPLAPPAFTADLACRVEPRK